MRADGSADHAAARLAAVHAAIRACRACALRDSCQAPVPGEGDAGARVVVIGEAPGADEDRTGRPFIGRSGQLLRRTLLEAGLGPERVFITNTVRCRPPDNRTPTAEERARCVPHLRAELAALTPTIVVLLGLTAVRGVLGAAAHGRSLGALRGWYDGPLPAALDGIAVAPRVFVTLHPAAALRSIVWRQQFRDDLGAIAGAVRRADDRPPGSSAGP